MKHEVLYAQARIRRSLWVNFTVFVLIILMAMSLQACIRPPISLPISAVVDHIGDTHAVPEESPVSPSVPVTFSAGVALFSDAGFDSIYEMFPIQGITYTMQLTDVTAMENLSQAYSGTVHLELALISLGDGKWKLVYAPDSVTLQIPTRWNEYTLAMNSPVEPGDTRNALVQLVLDTPKFDISETIAMSSPILSEAESIDLVSWIDANLDQQNPDYGSIARLLFTVVSAGESRRILYISGHLAENGEVAPSFRPDDSPSCVSNREGSLYCTILSWFGG